MSGKEKKFKKNSGDDDSAKVPTIRKVGANTPNGISLLHCLCWGWG
jgi:hypothetical protein